VAAHPEQHFRWTFELAAPPAALWPLVSNTDRFNRDCGYPPVTVLPPPARETGTITNARRLRASVMGVAIEWDELAFEWLAPARYGVERSYYSGPVAKMVMSCELTPRAGGGTTLVYDMRLTPSSLFGRLALPFSIGKQARATTERVFRRYDEFALRGLRSSQLAQKPKLADGGGARLEAIARALVAEAAQPAPLIARLQEFISTADDLAAARIRPYALADEWRADRRDTLHLFLHATRAGLVDFSWDLVCPHCRGAKASQSTLGTLQPHAHCDTCHVDFTANFDQSVELTFTPNASIRSVVRADYCVGGPQVTPHIVAQQRLAPGASRTLPLALAPGRYRVRSPDLAAQHAFRVRAEVEGGAASPKRPEFIAAIHPTTETSSPLRRTRSPEPVERERRPQPIEIRLGSPAAHEPVAASDGELVLRNDTATEHLAILEHLAWSDQATTAAEVTSLQLFRDLFSREVLRPGEQISVGSMTVVFTDLKNSTQLYQDIGDAPAFGRVLTHFEILKAAVAAENGCIVKTMGDAIMAVFPRPIAALRAITHAQRWLADPRSFALPAGLNVPPSSLHPLALKAGIHCGPCLAINQNDRLDYFGTTVNITARLCALCTGTDLVLSSAVCADHEVAAHLAAPDTRLRAAPERVTLKGFGDAAFEVWRVTR
jgi:class 3 adenylate cyclase